MSTEIIIGGRGWGKTRRCIEIAAKEQATIVCCTAEECRRVMYRAMQMGLSIPQPIHAGVFLSGQFYGLRLEKLVIDDICRLLQIHVNHHRKVIAITL